MNLNDLLRESQFNSMTDLQAATAIMKKNTIKLSDTESFYTWKTLNVLFPTLIPAIKGAIYKAIDQNKASNTWDVVGFLNDILSQLDSGVSFNNDLVLAGVTKLVQLNIVSQTTADKFTALGVVQKSLSDIHNLGVVNDSAVAQARQLNLTIDWFLSKSNLIVEKLYSGEITTKTQVNTLLNS